ncbi:unnamed protein product [Dibothriocephalus latus]|uniref:Uncharacterized protein n=1 Tax=Dibothriocephalus latus TaxID=60516 RepID=A0A3P7PES1_DIBLA|nr:unnamed protein product [Dibothriocephalus latus]
MTNGLAPRMPSTTKTNQLLVARSSISTSPTIAAASAALWTVASKVTILTTIITAATARRVPTPSVTATTAAAAATLWAVAGEMTLFATVVAASTSLWTLTGEVTHFTAVVATAT